MISALSFSCFWSNLQYLKAILMLYLIIEHLGGLRLEWLPEHRITV
jgi:hypothetical protein